MGLMLPVFHSALVSCSHVLGLGDTDLVLPSQNLHPSRMSDVQHVVKGTTYV